MKSITPLEAESLLQSHPDLITLDVRTPPEFKHRRIRAAINIPVDELYLRHRELDANKEIIVICEHGVRSVAATEILMQQGFENVYNVQGGMSQWFSETVSG